MIHVTTKIDRADAGLVDELGRFSAATIHEAQGRKGALDSDIKPIDWNMSFCGSAFTVVCHPRDNIMLQVAISYAQPGDVLVVSSGDQPPASSVTSSPMHVSPAVSRRSSPTAGSGTPARSGSSGSRCSPSTCASKGPSRSHLAQSTSRSYSAVNWSVPVTS